MSTCLLTRAPKAFGRSSVGGPGHIGSGTPGAPLAAQLFGGDVERAPLECAPVRKQSRERCIAVGARRKAESNAFAACLWIDAVDCAMVTAADATVLGDAVELALKGSQTGCWGTVGSPAKLMDQRIRPQSLHRPCSRFPAPPSSKVVPNIAPSY